MMRLSVLVIAFWGAFSYGQVVDLDEGDVEQIFSGEWMVMFYAPWCPACQRAKPEWKDFGSWGKDLDLHVGQTDVTKTPGLSGRFMITSLPSIFHIKDGVVRHYTGSKGSQDLIAFVDEKKWKDVEPVAWWMAPNTVQMRCVGSFFSFANFVRGLHTKMTEEYDVPSWGAYAIFAMATIVLGLALGFALVCCLDCVCPQTPPAKQVPRVPVTGAATKKSGAQATSKSVPVVAAAASVPKAATATASTAAAAATADAAHDDDDIDDDDVDDVSSDEQDELLDDEDDHGERPHPAAAESGEPEADDEPSSAIGQQAPGLSVDQDLSGGDGREASADATDEKHKLKDAADDLAATDDAPEVSAPQPPGAAGESTAAGDADAAPAGDLTTVRRRKARRT